MPTIKDMRGNYGGFSVIDISYRVGIRTFWRCMCNCGLEFIVRADVIKNRTGGCGCGTGLHTVVETKAKPIKTPKRPTGWHMVKHGKTETSEFRTWSSMISRCFDKNHKRYCDYGARGITVCERWRLSFAAFLEDMGERPSKDHSLDRIDNNRNYEPENCRWATRSQQGRNKRNNCILSIDGIEKTLTEWCEISGINDTTCQQRLVRGWSAKDAVFEPVQAR